MARNKRPPWNSEALLLSVNKTEATTYWTTHPVSTQLLSSECRPSGSRGLSRLTRSPYPGKASSTTNSAIDCIAFFGRGRGVRTAVKNDGTRQTMTAVSRTRGWQPNRSLPTAAKIIDKSHRATNSLRPSLRLSIASGCRAF